MAYLALDAVSAAVYATLNVAGLTALAPGGISDALGQGTTYPRVWYEVSERDVRGLGTGGQPEVTLRVHVFGTTTPKDVQAVAQKVIELLRDQALTITGYTHCGRVFYDETIGIGAVELGGELVHEAVSLFRIYVTE